MTPKLPRSLADEQKQRLTENFAPIRLKMSFLHFCSVAGDGEGYAYAQQFVDFFKSISFESGPVMILNPTSSNSEESGIVIGVKNLKNPPDTAKLFGDTLIKSGFIFHGGTVSTLGEDIFCVIITPQR
jgi:hypothetical protein